MEAVRPEIVAEDSTLSIHLFKPALSKVETQKAENVCLFKKSQHGGLLEIYVLGVEERIAQQAIETITIDIYKMFPYKTMTNPEFKGRKNNCHDKKAKKSEPVINAAKSDDAQQWNQGPFTTKLALILIELCSNNKRDIHVYKEANHD